MTRRQIALFLTLALGLFLLSSRPLLAETSVFINEIHYDNDGTDSGEAIEIAGPAGTDLTGWSLVLYNGAGGAVYTTTPLSGVIANQQNGFGAIFVSYPSNGIQNGSPDGLALVDAASNVVQFLSYEGSFTAVGGPADGLLSTDIGTSETATTPVGHSLQLTGSGQTYEDFTWAAAAANTFGAVNTGQNFTGAAADPLLNEFVFNHVGTDTHEFVEVAGDASTDYAAYTVLQIEGDGSGAGVVDSAITVGVTDVAGYWTAGFQSNVWENGTVTVLLVEGFSGSVGLDLDADDDGTLDSTPWTRLVDGVAVSDGGAGDQTYADTTLTPTFDGGTFTVGGASRIPDRTDTGSPSDWRRNDFDGAGLPGFIGTPDAGEAFNTPGAVNAAVATTPALVINEIDYDQPGTDAAEFVEIKNVGDTAVNLDGVTLELVNGNGNTIYQTITLPAAMLAVGDYYVVCGDAAAVANCDLDVTPDTNLVQNGAPDAVGLRSNGELLDAVSYEGDTGAPYTEGSGVGLEDTAAQATESISRCEDGVDTNQNNVDFVLADSTPGEANDCGGGGGGDIGNCGDPATFIHDIQGSGLTSPLVGTAVVIEGVVVGDFQNNGQPDSGELNGFYVQEEDSQADADTATSEGIFVFAPAAADVVVGDLVRLGGTVIEFTTSGGSSLTEIGSVGEMVVCASGNTLPAATAVTLPVTAVSDFERFEGMLVQFPQALTISEYFNFDRFNETVLSLGRQHQPTAVVEPGAAAIALAEAQALSRITLDDGRSNQNPDPAIHPNGNIFDLSHRFRGGDTVQQVTGVIDHTFGLYRIQPTQGALYSPENPRPLTPEAVGGNVHVSSFNVLNYFSTIDTGAAICGPAANQECRGADTPEEFERQRTKIIAALVEINADVVGLIELENHATDAALQDLVAGLNDALGAGTYAAISTGPIGTDAIKVAIIYKPATMTPVGGYAILDSSVDSRFLDTKNRPVLAQTFTANSGGTFTLAINHLKSKGSDCNDVGDPDTGDGQGNCNLTRLAAAQALVDWLAADPTGSGDSDFLIMGDLNSYDKEDPIDAILAGADDAPGTGDDYTDLVAAFQGELAYGYVFDGKLGYLDHALSNASLTPQVTGVTEWHINADEPDLLDYDMTFKQDAQDALYEPNAFRSSDHDPVIVGLNLNAAPVCDSAVASPASLWPVNHHFVPISILGVTDPDGDSFTLTVDAIFQDEPVPGPGNKSDVDGMGVGTATALLRAERDGGGNGRVYHVYFTAVDAHGSSCSGTVLVGVPKSEGSGGEPVDDGPLYDSTGTP
ncbi:MAG: ExeM/NucH family extracellular endonuclease [Anaerolineae bacterium]|nr:ExeM/NucH family extracellular endonuclease [Anaerolineae bacterium]